VLLSDNKVVFYGSISIILETAVGSQKSAQALGAPGKLKKCRITTEVTTNFFISPGTPISSTLVLRPTAVSRINEMNPEEDYVPRGTVGMGLIGD